MQNFTELVSLRDRTGGNASLTATFFVPDRPRASILLPAAMGVTQKFYADFAQWLAQRDFLVATFDYRGMGLSAPASLRGCDLSISDWTEFDCAAMVDTLKSRLPDRPLFLIGHSLGGQIVGLIPNRRSIDAVVLVASGSGYWREVSKSARRNSVLLWFVLVPLLTRLFSYFPGKALHIVGDLPRGVVEQWRRWCLSPEYLISSESASVRDDYAAVRTPMLSLSFTDDEMMSALSTESLHRFYANASIEKMRLAPDNAGVERIGHFGFFRKQFARNLWPSVAHWLEQQL